MRLVNFICTPDSDLAGQLEAQGISDSQHLLVQIFSGEFDQEAIGRIIGHVASLLPSAVIIGATTGGELINGEALEETTVLSVCEFEHTRLEYTAVDADGLDSFRLGRELCRRLDHAGAKLLIAFATGLNTNGDEFARGVGSVRGDLPLAGGFAGDYRRFRRTLVFSRDGIIHDGAVAVALHNADLLVNLRYSLDWIPLGRALEITRADRNRIYSIDDEPALEIYKRYLGKDVAERMPVLGMQFPLMVQRQGRTVARGCLAAVDDGSVLYQGNIIEGEQVRFGLGNPNSIIQSIEQMHQSLVSRSVEGIFLYSSMARKRLMKHSASLEAHYFQTLAPTVGFFTYGEFYHLPEANEFFNYTMTALTLSESRDARHPAATDIEQIEATDTHLELRALSNLINVTSRELEHVNESLEHLATVDPLTETYNRRKINELVASEIVRRRRYRRRASLIMFDLDDFKLINDGFGHDMGDIVLKTVTNTVKEMVRGTDYLGRWGGEEFIILCTETSLEDATTLAERMRATIQERHDQEVMRLTISVGVSEIRPEDNVDSVLKRVDVALYRAKRAGKNCVRA